MPAAMHIQAMDGLWRLTRDAVVAQTKTLRADFPARVSLWSWQISTASGLLAKLAREKSENLVIVPMLDGMATVRNEGEGDRRDRVNSVVLGVGYWRGDKIGEDAYVDVVEVLHNYWGALDTFEVETPEGTVLYDSVDIEEVDGLQTAESLNYETLGYATLLRITLTVNACAT